MADDDKNKKPLSLNDRLLFGLSHSRQDDRAHKVKIEGRRRLCKLSSASDDTIADEKLFDSPPRKHSGDGGESIRDILDDLSSRLETLSVEKHHHKPLRRDAEPSFCLSGFDDDDDVEEVEKREDNKGKAVKAPAFDGDVEEDCVAFDEDDGQNEESFCDGDGDRDDVRLDGMRICKAQTYVLPGKIAKRLYPHQRDGLVWLWSLHCGGTGGILGDDMGLGKTMQVSAYLAGLFHSELINRALIVAPKTLIAHWMKELTVVGLAEKIRDYSGASQKLREYELQHILKEGGVLLTTYDIVRNNYKSIRADWYAHEESDEGILWDYTILDEGHIIKNPNTQRAKSLLEVPSPHRIVISGTPIQNNLKELWALFNFCCPEILGDKNEFKIRYELPILRGNDKNASDREKHVGSTVAKELRNRIKPHFLRRLKTEVFPEDDTAKGAKLSKKNEIIVWLKLTSCQRQLYEAFLKSEMVHSSISGSPLAALTILKKICDHPLLLTKKGAEGILEGMDSMLNREELGMVEEMATSLANMNDNKALQLDHNVSCKINFILSLLKNLVEEGHTMLIFSQTRKMLNLIQEAIILEGYKFIRIDGTTKVSERERIVKDFQEGLGAPIFLLTSQVGGLGLTLTKADRVIVVDPAWNPSMDNQSVDRAYRIGQLKDVIVYRLMTCGTIEEKIYKMQVFKGSLFKTATEHKEQTRYFSQKDIRELFSLPEQGFDVSLTQQQLNEEHDRQHIMDETFTNHLKFLQRQGIAGVSHHSLLFSKAATTPFVQENLEVESKPRNRVVRSSSRAYVEPDIKGAQYAFNPKDERSFSRPNFTASLNEGRDSPELIEERIKRLSQTLGNKALVLKLPDRGDKIRKQMSELNLQLIKIRDSPPVHDTEKTQTVEVIDLDSLSEDLQRVVSV
ncbi:protein CHROMATIN REMODELING 24 [Dioscorea cayenensis subsp. rotundata]|uniref:Protein CHROMATIN REMODELING 24 n=1 Tax=Dioscorea cayennensis subsp. rotundata TaxID=55577 RepID=A0AB40CGM3_DIOCR|nr:protein CHROMATIN REMODELING 24 [Dioscorea cayenensis subsp. rotundata]